MEIDKALVAERFMKASATYDLDAEVQRHAAGQLVEIIRLHAGESFPSILEIGCGTGELSRRLARAFRPERLILNDLCPDMRLHVDDLLAEGAEFVPGDAETVVSAVGMNLAASSSVVQWLAEPGALFRRWRAEMAPGGWLAFSSYSLGNLREIASLTGTGLLYRSLAEWREILAPGWRVVAEREETRQLVFPSPIEVLRHLQRTGVTGVARGSWSRRTLRDFCREYERRFSRDGGGVEVTYRPQYVVAQALRNGSAPKSPPPSGR